MPPLRIKEQVYRTSTIVEVKWFLRVILKKERAIPDQAVRELSVGEVARRAGVPVSTLHFYEAQGLIESRRTSGNQRRYPRTVLRLIAVIRVAQRTGIPLAQIKERLDRLPKNRPIAATDWTLLSSGWKIELDERITLLMRLRDQLTTCIGCGCLSATDCPLRNPGDIAAKKGPGARLFDLNSPGAQGNDSTHEVT
jgi:MerR family redox-sensitive transcriptional activator SoxR